MPCTIPTTGSRRPRIAAAVMLLLLFYVSSTLFAGEIVFEENITYGKGGDVDLQLDLARPAEGDGPFPAVVCIHGGGWIGGKRQGFRPLIKTMAQRGYVAVTVTYRLTQPDKDGKPKYPFPAQVHDVKCAVRWVRANAKKYHVDSNRIGVAGGSAGGHLSLMVGLADKSAKLEGHGGHAEESSRVQAVVNFFGPTELVKCHETTDRGQPLVRTFLNGTPGQVPDQYRAASPLTYVSKDDPPVLTLHGADDTLVPPEQAKLLDAKMKQVGASHTLMILEGQGHGFRGDANRKAYSAMFDFFDKHLKNKK